MKSNFHGSIGLGITLISRTRRAALSKALAGYGFPAPMYEIAMYIGRNPGVSQDTVTEATRFDKATVARGAQKLEALGYLQRQNSDRDRRQYELYLTESGRKLADDARQAVRAWTDSLTRGLSDSEKQQMISLLERIAENIE